MSYNDEFPALTLAGLMACPTTGAGNCLFHALSDQIYGHQEQHQELRGTIVQHMRDNPKVYKNFIPVGGQRRAPKRKTVVASKVPERFSQAEYQRAWDRYLGQMSKSGTYGDHIEIQAFATAFNVNVMIFHPGSPPNLIPGNDQTAQSAYIARHTYEHYSSVRNIEGPSAGLPGVQHPLPVVLSEPSCTPSSASSPSASPSTNGSSMSPGTTSPTPPPQFSPPPSFGCLSQLGCSSIERDLDSEEDDEIYGPNKRHVRLESDAMKGLKTKRVLATTASPLKEDEDTMERGFGSESPINFEDKVLESIEVEDQAADGSQQAPTPTSSTGNPSATPAKPRIRIILHTRSKPKIDGLKARKLVSGRVLKEQKKARQTQAATERELEA